VARKIIGFENGKTLSVDNRILASVKIKESDYFGIMKVLTPESRSGDFRNLIRYMSDIDGPREWEAEIFSDREVIKTSKYIRQTLDADSLEYIGHIDLKYYDKEDKIRHIEFDEPVRKWIRAMTRRRTLETKEEIIMYRQVDLLYLYVCHCG
jgi:hypothetical protein